MASAAQQLLMALGASVSAVVASGVGAALAVGAKTAAAVGSSAGIGSATAVSSGVSDAWAAIDGRLNAPASRSPQNPTMLSAYGSYRPPWQVAGVDYGVGIPGNLGTLPSITTAVGVVSGLSISGSLVRVDTSSNVVVDGYDFSIGASAPYHIAFLTSPGGIVRRCRFTGGGVDSDSSSPGLSVTYCDFNGFGFTMSSFITASGGGATVINYNFFKNGEQHVLERNNGGTSLDYRFNYIENMGTGDGAAHVNYNQEQGSPYLNSLIAFNTATQAQENAGGEGIQAATNTGSTFTTYEIAYNTMITTGPGDSLSYMMHISYAGGAVTGLTVHDNYFDATYAFGAFYPESGFGASYSNNLSMLDGSVITGPA